MCGFRYTYMRLVGQIIKRGKKNGREDLKISYTLQYMTYNVMMPKTTYDDSNDDDNKERVNKWG